MDFLIGEFFGAILSFLLVAPIVLIFIAAFYTKKDSNGDGLSG